MHKKMNSYAHLLELTFKSALNVASSFADFRGDEELIAREARLSDGFANGDLATFGMRRDPLSRSHGVLSVGFGAIEMPTLFSSTKPR